MVKMKHAQKRSYRLGLDIGSYAVKAVELAIEKDAVKLAGFAVAEIGEKDTDERIKAAVQEAVSKTGGKTKDAAIALSGPGVIVRYIELPLMTEGELKNAIVFEAEKYIPFKIDDIILDHQILIPQKPDKKMLVLLVAAKKDLINRRIEFVRELGLNPVLIDVTPLALVNAFFAGGGAQADKIAALISIGHRFTDINIVSGEMLMFTRSINVGGWDLARMVAEGSGADPASAMKSIREDKGGGEALDSSIRRGIENIIEEIRLSFSYFENQFDTNIGSIYCTGGCARLAPLAQMIKEGIGIEPLLWDPAKSLQIEGGVSREELGAAKGLLGVSIGLAMRD